MRITRSALALGLGLAVAVATAPASARAQEVTFAGSATGYFNGIPSPTPTLYGLTYVGSTFNTMTSNGFLGIGNDAFTGPGGTNFNGTTGTNFNNLGAFSLSTMAQNYNIPGPGVTSNTFTLLVTFTAPPGTTPQPATFTAAVTGSVTSNNMGGVLIDFDNTVQTFSFTGGTFTFNVNDLSINAGKTVAVTGTIRSQVVPEPASMTLLATGLAGLGAAARRRKNKK